MQKVKISPLGAVFIFIGAGTAFAMYYLFTGMEYCESHTFQTVPGPANYDVNIMEEGCDGIAGSDTMSVVLVSKLKKREKIIFVFGREQADPIVTWSNNDLQISIDTIFDIDRRVKEFDGVKINYQIGRVVHPEKQP